MNLYYIYIIEKIIYFTTWIFAVIYAVYCFAAISFKYFKNHHDDYEDFTTGWHFLSKNRDKADFEWEIIYYLLSNFYLWILLFLFVSEIIRNLPSTIKNLKLWQITFTLIFIQLKFGYIFVCMILYQPAIFYFTKTLSKSVLSTWMCTGISLWTITYLKQVSAIEDFRNFSALNEQGLYIIALSLFWLNLKCTSYYLEKQDSTRILDFLSYCLYPPTMFSGPFISYHDFSNIYKQTEYLPTKQRIRRLIANLTRSLFWFMFGNFGLHYVYVNATSFQPKLVKTFSGWSLYGYGYAMGQYFHIKYLVLYGLSTCCASFENVNVPRLPRCIGRIHLYSDMWKYFDPGLYGFLVKHIYVPVMKIFSSKLIGSFSCFLFVYLWHGIEQYVLIWSILNYSGVTIEYFFDFVNKKYFQDKEHVKLLNPNSFRRIKCFLSAPLLALSAISNFYFFAGIEIGNIFFRRLYMDNFGNNILLLYVLYCCCQVSVEIRRIDANQM